MQEVSITLSGMKATSHLTGMNQVQFLWSLEWKAGSKWYACLKCKPEIPLSQRSLFCLRISPVKGHLLVIHSKRANIFEKPYIHRRLNQIIHKYIHTCIHTHIQTYILHPSLPYKILAPIPTSYQTRCCCMCKTPH